MKVEEVAERLWVSMVAMASETLMSVSAASVAAVMMEVRVYRGARTARHDLQADSNKVLAATLLRHLPHPLPQEDCTANIRCNPLRAIQKCTCPSTESHP